MAYKNVAKKFSAWVRTQAFELSRARSNQLNRNDDVACFSEQLY